MKKPPLRWRGVCLGLVVEYGEHEFFGFFFSDPAFGLGVHDVVGFESAFFCHLFKECEDTVFVGGHGVSPSSCWRARVSTIASMLAMATAVLSSGVGVGGGGHWVGRIIGSPGRRR